MLLPRILLAAVLATAAPLFASIELPREGERWTRLDLDDYVVYSNARDAVTRDVASRLQLLRDSLAVVTKLNVRPPQRVNVIVFQNTRSLAPYRDVIMKRKASNVTALHASTRDAEYILVDADAGDGIDRSVYHELTHSFTVNTVNSGLPLWFAEGLAEFYSTFRPDRDKLRIGSPVVEHLAWLQERGLMPLERLFAVDAQSPEYSETYRAGDFYAQSWLLVHYLMIGNSERTPQLGKFLAGLDAKQPVDVAFKEAFGANYKQLENELHHYLGQPTMNVLSFTPTQVNAQKIGDPIVAPRDEVLAMLGNLLVRTSPSDARPFLESAIKSNAACAEAYAGLGILAETTGKPGDGDPFFERATAAGSTSARAYVWYGQSLMTKLDASHGPLSGAPIERVRALFDKAIALAPRSPIAWGGLGATYLFTAGDEQKGIAALEQSLALSPRQEDVATNLSVLYARLGRRDLAAKTIETYIVPRADAPTLARAKESLVLADLRQAVDLAQAGKRTQAMALLETARKSATSESMKKVADETLARMLEADAADAQIDSLNHALHLARDGHLKEALELVDNTLPSITDPELQKNARDLRAKLLAATRKK